MLTELLNKLVKTSGQSPVSQALLSRDELLQIYQTTLQYAQQQQAHLPMLQHSTMGDLPSHYLGSGMDHEESRLYQPGDELRHLNWRMTARTGDLYTRIFREERKPCLFTLIDRRSMMRFGTRTRLKVTQAVSIAATYAFLASIWQLPVGAYLLQEKAEWIQDKAGLDNILACLIRAASPCPPIPQTQAEPSLKQALNLLNSRLTYGSRVILISDFHELQEQDKPVLQNMQQRFDLLAINIFDPAEIALPRSGQFRISPVSGQSVTDIDSNLATLSGQFRENMKADQDRIKQLFSGCGIPLLHCNTHLSLNELLAMITQEIA
jgi:uncharacterized protein (DUF58 family)